MIFFYNFNFQTNPELSKRLLIFWKTCCAVRAVSASIAWLILALGGDNNELANDIKRLAIKDW